MNYILAQIFICLLIAALLGMLIGWLLCKSKCGRKRQQTKTSGKDKGCKNNASNNDSASAGTTSDSKSNYVNPDESKYNASAKDNLRLIKGVGATLEKVLNDIGVYKFEQIASWTPEQASQVDDIIAFPGRIEREKWISQCKRLQHGQSTEFSKRVEKGEVPTSKS